RAFAARLSRAQGLFATGKAALMPSGSTTIADLAQIAQACPVVLQIESHTANTGPTAFNEQLSGQRAEAIRSALHAYGISPERLVPLGFGEHRPLANNSTFEGRNRNERIEIRIFR
ncbi:MAG: OmpA family protein, partial [Myxococcota bacterium]